MRPHSILALIVENVMLGHKDGGCAETGGVRCGLSARMAPTTRRSMLGTCRARSPVFQVPSYFAHSMCAVFLVVGPRAAIVTRELCSRPGCQQMQLPFWQHFRPFVHSVWDSVGVCKVLRPDACCLLRSIQTRGE